MNKEFNEDEYMVGEPLEFKEPVTIVSPRVSFVKEFTEAGKCNCITCKHVAEMRKLIPDEDLCNKVMAITDDLYESMAGEVMELEQINGILREQNEDIIKANTRVEKEKEVLREEQRKYFAQDWIKDRKE